jgi:uncharacterized protein YecE (DUF72 family)
MNAYVGTSGYGYKEWKRLFYPEKLPAKDMLRYHGEHLPAVGIDNTFYRMPKRSVLETWAYQVPPCLRKDVDRLAESSTLLTPDTRAAVEFRHDSWCSDDVCAILSEHDRAPCGADTDDGAPAFDAAPTANRGYVRLRREACAPADLDVWAEHPVAQPREDPFVFVKHEGSGSEIAAGLRSAAATNAGNTSDKSGAKKAVKNMAKQAAKKTARKSPASATPRKTAPKRTKRPSVTTKKSSTRSHEAS